MRASTLENLLLGAAAGLTGTVIQTAIGKTEDLLFLPPGEDSNIAPRMVDRLMKRLGVDPSLATEWALGTVYHLGYGASWGVAYAAVRERRQVHPLLGGTLLGGLIYGITFPRWGGAVQTGTERHPERRSPQMEVVAASVAFGYGVATAYAYEYLRTNDAACDLARRLTGGEREEGERVSAEAPGTEPGD